MQADVRTPDGQALSWATGADVEALAWLPDQPTQFLVSTEDGLVTAFDARKGGGARYDSSHHCGSASACSHAHGRPLRPSMALHRSMLLSTDAKLVLPLTRFRRGDNGV